LGDPRTHLSLGASKKGATPTIRASKFLTENICEGSSKRRPYKKTAKGTKAQSTPVRHQYLGKKLFASGKKKKTRGGFQS